MAFANIAISGRIACGSTTLARAIAQKLQWPLRDASQIFRDISAHLGHDLEKNPQQYGEDIDRKVDGETQASLVADSNIVIASKLAGFLSRGSDHTCRILVACNVEERVKRYGNHRGYLLDEARKLLLLREEEDQKKWERLYGSNDFFDPSFFHLVLDSNTLPVEQEVSEVIATLAANRVS